LVDQNPPLPGNVIAKIRSVGLIGSGATIVLFETGVKNGKLKAGQTIPGEWIGLDVLPPEFAELARELKHTSEQFRESNLVKHMDDAVVKATETIESVRQLVNDEKTRAELKQAVTNIRQATETANRIGTNLEKFSVSLNDMTRDANTTIKQVQTNVDKLTNQVNDRIGQVGKLLGTFQSIAQKMDEGKGTAGMLINDPKLYESLVDTSRELNGAIRDLQRVLEQWEQEGPSIRLH
jgi:phospholipid/cholesterol/gamma-HCH transport system substrate-binding protein